MITRRQLLATAPLTALPILPQKCQPHEQEYVNATDPFLHGVASGDPMQDAVILWTRVTGDAGAPAAFGVGWQVFEDVACVKPVLSGVAATDSSLDFTVKVDARGLKAGRTYYYRFFALGHESELGRTRTLPKGRVDRVRFAVASCSNFPYGYFNAYRSIAERADLDAVLHLGDYLYEYANGDYGNGTTLGRAPLPDKEIVTLSDYRQRHAQYKTDPDLREAHRQHPFITIWDDHESANNSWTDGAENHQPETEGDWAARKAAAIQAYFEWMPIRALEQDGTGRIYRSFAFGNLADLVMLDTRLYGRNQEVADACDRENIADPERQLLGAAQEAWLIDRLAVSQQRGTRWRLVGQQVMFAQLINVLAPGNCIFNADQWDGYSAARQRVLDALATRAVDNVVILTGDIHSSWGNDIAHDAFDPQSYDPASGAGSVAVEFVAPAVTSPGIEDPIQAAGFAQALRATHPHIKFVELNKRGYLLLDVTKERAQAEWYHLPTVAEPTSSVSLASVLVVESGKNHLEPGTSASIARNDAPALAPTRRDASA